MVRHDLRARLMTGADNQDPRDIGLRKDAGRQRANRGRSDPGEMVSGDDPDQPARV